MSKKKLQVEGIKNELEGGASLFFSKSPTPPPSLPVQEPSVSPSPQILSQNAQPLNKTSDKISHPETPVQKKEKVTIKENNERTVERTNQRKVDESNERYFKRHRIRHTFDIFDDQLLSLRELTIQEEKETGERVLLGDLAQQALDMLITKYKNK